MPLFASVSSEGRIVITDFELGAIGVSPDREWEGPLTRPGDGPGEVSLACQATWTDEGGAYLGELRAPQDGRLVG
jgi:hypothetical protein